MVIAQEKIEWQQQPIKRKSADHKHQPQKRRPRYAKGKSILVLACIFGMISSAGAETIHLTVVQGEKVRSLEKEIATIKAQKDLLQVEADKLRAVGRIESAAIAMGMEKPAGIVYVTGAVPAVKNQKGAPLTQTVTRPTETKSTALRQFSQLFTSFFASTQR